MADARTCEVDVTLDLEY